MVRNSRSIPVRLSDGTEATLGWVVSDLRLKIRRRVNVTRATFSTTISLARYLARVKRQKAPAREMPEHNFQSYVISLKNRKKRLEMFLPEAQKLSLKSLIIWEATDGSFRYPQLGSDSGRRGCAQSHIELLNFHESRHPTMPALVFEDDFRLREPELANMCIDEFLGNDALDVLCLHGYFSKAVKISDNLSISSQISSTAGYLAKPTAFTKLHNAFLRASGKLEAGHRGRRFGIDVAWQRLQWTTLVFAVPNAYISFQEAGYSDIENQNMRAR